MRALKRLGIAAATGAAIATVVVFGSEKALNTRVSGGTWLGIVLGVVVGVEGHYLYLSRRRKPAESVQEAVNLALDEKLPLALAQHPVKISDEQMESLLRQVQAHPIKSAEFPTPSNFASPFDEVDPWEGKGSKVPVNSEPKPEEIDWSRL